MQLTHIPEIIEIKDFYSSVLDNSRSLYVCLPPSYESDQDRCYPVLYMQDGQNIFDGETSYSGAGWEIHRIAHELAVLGEVQELIIIGIGHQNQMRLSEYAHCNGRFQGNSVQGRGLLYESFLINEVKPYIENAFRTLGGPENTGLMGSSMGGLVTFNIALRNPHIFGKAGVVSPSFWWGGSTVLKMVKAVSHPVPVKMWLDMGEAEGEFSKGFAEVLDAIEKKGLFADADFAVWRVPEAIHSESDWMKRVHCPLRHLFGEIGHPQELQLTGRSVLGQSEATFRMSVTAVFSTGFSISPRSVTFYSSDPEVLTIDRDGEAKPLKCGSAVVIAQWESLEVRREFIVVPHLSPQVTVTVNIRTPYDEKNEKIFIGAMGPDDYECRRTEAGYRAAVTLARDSVLSFKITRGTWDSVEKDGEGNDISPRRVTASQDMYLDIDVQSW